MNGFQKKLVTGAIVATVAALSCPAVFAMGGPGGGGMGGGQMGGGSMGGQMGGDRVTTQNLQLLKVIPEHNLLLVKGSVAGCKGSIVLIKE